ncbi:MAG: hypothetical protein AAGL69_15225 [Pseudomonadota bacterium]
MKRPTLLFGSLGLALLSATAQAKPIVDEKRWTETFDVSDAPRLTVDVIWGDVIVERGNNDQIEMTIESIRRADDQTSFERSLEQIPLRLAQDGDEVFLRVGRDWRHWNELPPCRGCSVTVNVVVRVPTNSAVDVSSVNDGRVIVSDVAGMVTASNVNGGVSTSGLSQCAAIESVNGDVIVGFAQSPLDDCDIETLNGDINVSLPDGAHADFAVSLANGKMRSEIDLTPRAMKAQVQHTQRGDRHYYEIDKRSGLRLGRGGSTLSLKSLNGDVLVERSQ